MQTAAALLLALAAAAAPAADTLSTLDTAESATRGMIGAPAPCKVGFVAARAPSAREALPLPADGGGATFTAAEAVRWRGRLDNDDSLDWQRVRRQAAAFMSAGEDPSPERDRGNHGMKARDAAFVFLVNREPRYAEAVGRYLVAAAAEPVNDFTALCFRNADDSAPFDAYYEQAAWLLRYVVSYDYARAALPAAQRLAIENYLRRQAWFFAAHLDWGLALAFPQRLGGNYAARSRDAAPRTASEAVATKRFDSNGDCRIDGADDPAAHAVHAYIDADGKPGPQLSRLSLWFNNRRSAAALAAGSAGLLLNDAQLVNRAKRYVMEWLTYSVWPDGSQGEYFRNGDYCIPRQGLIYAQYNIQAAVLLARWTRQSGDDALLRFSTTAGLFGSDGTPAKSIAAVVRAELALLSGELERYATEPWKGRQQPRPETSLARGDSRYMNSGGKIDNQHALGLLLAEDVLPDLPLARVLRGRAGAAAERQRGGDTAAPRVATGYGQWQDVFGALPAVLLLVRP